MRTIRNYVSGRWVESESPRTLAVENPSTGETIALVPLSSAAETGRALDAAAGAYESWSSTPVSRRAEHIHHLAGLLRSREEELARLISLENGKSLPDSRAEIKRTLQNCEAACAVPLLQQGDTLIGAAAGIDGEVMRLPLGVFTMIAPFNFPAMVPFWFLPYALATGNTFVIKPSEQTPLTMERIAEIIGEIDLPPGVFNLVNGDREVAETFIEHPRVRGVSLVGSTRTCRAVAERCVRAGKRFQAMGGAKNHLVVMPDAHIDEVIRNMTSSCYGCAGQRCMASSAIIAVGDETYDTCCERFIDASRRIVVADPLDPAVADEAMVMGPVISERAREFILGMIETGIREGATLALDGRGLVVEGRENGHFLGPTVFTGVEPGSEIHRTEIFGPVVVILRASSLDEAIAIINAGEYGNGASIYTRSGYLARRFKLEVECGMIGINVGIPAPVAHLPFGGVKASMFSDIKAQGRAVVSFFTDERIVTERYWPEE